ncbi:C1 family peptidase [Flavobacterium circumlabens]|nr:C1 family peptidase [Flavobacterium circumlabens]
MTVTNVYCQDKINFSAFTPTSLDQNKGTCFAYAATYTALTIKFAIKMEINSAQDINLNAFSSAFTASRIQSEKNFFKRLFTSCSIGGNIEKAAAVLVKYGAVPVSNQLCCYTIPKAELTLAANYAIKGYTTIIKIDTSREDFAKLMDVIKPYLLKKEPVICAIAQTESLRNNKDLIYQIKPEIDAKNDYKESNHAICVVGFDDTLNGGSLLIKNNYKSFGSNGLSWITYKDFNKYLSYAIILEDFVSTISDFPPIKKYDPSEIYK